MRYLCLMQSAPPVAMTIAGSDSSAGAGMQADLKTFQFYQVHGLTAVTCVVSETSQTVEAIEPMSASMVANQVDLLLKSYPIAAVKTGMLYSPTIIRAVSDLLKPHSIPLVIDPVMVASSGASLLEPEAVDLYKTDLFPIATIITPNIPEAEALLSSSIENEADMKKAALELSGVYQTAILLKGGHLGGDCCIDILAYDGKTTRFEEPRIGIPESHGTGCTLSAAIAANLARGESLSDSVQYAKSYLTKAIKTSFRFTKPDNSPIHALNQGTVR